MSPQTSKQPCQNMYLDINTTHIHSRVLVWQCRKNLEKKVTFKNLSCKHFSVRAPFPSNLEASAYIHNGFSKFWTLWMEKLNPDIQMAWYPRALSRNNDQWYLRYQEFGLNWIIENCPRVLFQCSEPKSSKTMPLLYHSQLLKIKVICCQE